MDCRNLSAFADGTFDLVLMLGNGRVLEIGHPAKLLQDPGSELSGMVAAQGLTAS